MKDLTTAYFEIIKADKRDDGTLMVYGKATDDSLDIDQQICDPLWLDRAMPEWFKSGGNIREQHSSIAAGVAKEYEKKADGHYIHALVVDPISVKKVDTGVLKGFSIGIKSPRVVRDQKAANGRIIDGQIVEVSLVDRPANPNCQLVLAKSVDGETGMWKTEELIEKEQTREDNGRFGPSTSPKEETSGGYRPNNTDQEEIRRVIDDNEDSVMLINDMSDEESDDYEELSDDDEDIVDDAIDSIKEGNAALEEAYSATNEGARASALENAMVRYDEAHDALRSADSRTLQSIGDDIDSRMSDIEAQYDAIMDKSVTGDLNKEQTREDNGRFGPSTSPKEQNSSAKNSDIKECERQTGKVITDLKTYGANAMDDPEKFEKETGVPAEEVQSTINEAQGHLETAFRDISYAHGKDSARQELLLSRAEDQLNEASRIFASGPTTALEEYGRVIDRIAEDVMMTYTGKSASIALQLSETTDKAEKSEVMDDKTKKKELKPAKGESRLDFMKRCKEAGMKRAEARGMYDKFMAGDDEEEAEMEKSAESHKCLECGCGIPDASHGRANVSTADMIAPEETPKSAEPTEEVAELENQELPVAEDKVSEGSNLSEEIEAIVEKAIKSATESLKSEIAELANAHKAAVTKAVGLESELAVAKSLAVAGGPKRTIKPVDHSTNDLLVKAATYKAKADASTDPDLTKGYNLLAKKYFAEADALTKSN